MIAFGCAISEPEPYRRYAEPGLERVRESDSEVLAFAAVDTLARSLNILLDAAAERPDLEALVLVNPSAEFTDPRLPAQIRAALADPQVAVAGPLGARGVESIAWWEGEVSCASGFRYAYHEHGGGEMPGLPWTLCRPAPAEVDAIDGSVMILSPWAVGNLRFDETLPFGHGIDVDFCLQARAAGRRLVTVDSGVREWRSLKIVGEAHLWTEAHIAFSRKWAGRIPGTLAADDVEAAARRMEAEREAERSMAYFKRLSYDARVEPYEQEFKAATRTLSWRMTEPLRRLNLWRARRRQAADATAKAV